MNPTGAGSTGWSFQIATAIGIPIRVHFTFVLLVVWFVYAGARLGDNPALAAGFLLLVFGCVVLHELGHAAMARRFGVRTSEIVLYPIGGVARLENIPTGKAELWIALAGPAVNLVLGIALLVVVIFSGLPLLPSERLLDPVDLVPRLLLINVMLFGFNLLPAFPMDGGRVLRASLSLALPADRATEIAAAVGQGMAVLFGLAGILSGQVLLMLIALFVFIGASQEAAFHRQRSAVTGKTARAAMITRFETLSPQDSLAHASERLLATHQQDFPVVDAWRRVVGVLTRASLFEGLARLGSATAVLEVMQRDFGSVAAADELDRVVDLLRENPTVPVMVLGDEHQLLGMITLDNVSEFVELARNAGDLGDAGPQSR